jgi:transposase
MARAEQQDITRLDDPELLAERRRVRGELEAHPTPELTEQYERLDEEFIRRAGIAWSQAKP